MNKWKIISIVVFSVGFISLNSYLIHKEDSEVQRTVYVEEWNRVQKGNVVETFETDGVIKPQDEYPVYFHDNDKEFQRFLVKEGDEVTAGNPLFEYTTPELDKLRETLELEIQQLEGEIAGIDDYISSLIDYQSTIPTTSSASEQDTFFEQDTTFEQNTALQQGLSIEIDKNASSEMIISTIEQEIYKQELEKSKLEEEIKKYESQVSYLNEEDDTAMAVSEIDGIVKDVNEKLGNPVVTIASNVLSVEGLLTEKQLKAAETGMKLTAKVEGENTLFEGTLGKINAYPVKEPAIAEENLYHFQATFTEPQDSLVIGSDAKVSVVTAEALGVLTVSDLAIHRGKNPFIYRLNENGRITRQNVQPGLRFAGIQEINKGTEIGETILISPYKVPQNKAHYVTKIKPNHIKKSAFHSISKPDKLEAFLIGLIEK